MNNIYVTLVLCLRCILALSGEEGDNCNLLNGRNGTCTDLKRCPQAIALLKNGKFPQVCGFNGLSSLVCCEEEKSLLTTKTGILSLSKCNEYSSNPTEEVLVPGGTPSFGKEFPHMAAVGFGEKDSIQWQCGGSLISMNFILTAAHCLNSRDLGPARWIRLGELDFASDVDAAQPQDFTIKRRIPHPDYKFPSRYHDIALIELDRDVSLSGYVAIACLDTERKHQEKQMIATGWGKTEFAGEYSSFLLKVKLDLVTSTECQKHYINIPKDNLQNGIVDDYQICAGGKVGQDTCQGDSGGPLQIRNLQGGGSGMSYHIVGVTSFGKACGVSRSPGVYTRVYTYLSWIENIVWST